jgi:hypothetical protein
MVQRLGFVLMRASLFVPFETLHEGHTQLEKNPFADPVYLKKYEVSMLILLVVMYIPPLWIMASSCYKKKKRTAEEVLDLRESGRWETFEDNCDASLSN